MLPLSSPLLLLQVSKLQSLGLAADHLAGDDRARHSGVMVRLRRDPLQLTLLLLYVTPEKAVSSCSFLPPAPQIVASGELGGVLRSLHNRQCLTRFMMYEAHCVSCQPVGPRLQTGLQEDRRAEAQVPGGALHGAYCYRYSEVGVLLLPTSTYLRLAPTPATPG